MKALPICLALLITAAATAATVELSFHYDDLPLKNGKDFKDVSLKSYNTVSGNVSAVSGRQLLSLPLAQFPDEIAGRIRDCAPKMTADEIQEEKGKQWRPSWRPGSGRRSWKNGSKRRQPRTGTRSAIWM